MTPPRTYRDYLADMLNAIDDIAVFTLDLELSAFAADRKTVYAVTRALEIIGEAAKLYGKPFTLTFHQPAP